MLGILARAVRVGGIGGGAVNLRQAVTLGSHVGMLENADWILLTKRTHIRVLIYPRSSLFKGKKWHVKRAVAEMPRSDEAAAWFAAVYQAVQEIPHGKVTSYGHIARLLGKREWEEVRHRRIRG